MASPTLVPALAVVPQRKVTMWNLEEHLREVTEANEMAAAQQEQDFLVDLHAAMMSAKDKRDAVDYYIVQCRAQAAIADTEIERLTKRRDRFLRAIERMTGYVLRVIMMQPRDGEGGYPKLHGSTFTYAARQNPPSVKIKEVQQIPAACKRVEVNMPAHLWDKLLDSLEAPIAAEVLELTRTTEHPIKALIKEEIAMHIPDWKTRLEVQPSVGTDKVPGAAIQAGTWRLERE